MSGLTPKRTITSLIALGLYWELWQRAPWWALAVTLVVAAPLGVLAVAALVHGPMIDRPDARTRSAREVAALRRQPTRRLTPRTSYLLAVQSLRPNEGIDRA